MEFCKKDDEMLIHLVRNEPLLYDVTLEDYRNPQKKDEAWREIGKELSRSSEDCKKRWKHIKDSYNRFKRKTKASKFISIRSKWKTYELLSFLEARIQRRGDSKMVTEKNQNSDIDEQSHDEGNASLNVFKEEMFLDETVNNYESDTSTGTNKLGTNEDHENASDIFKITYEPMLKPVAQSSNSEIDSFCHHVGDVLKSLPPMYRIKAKQQIYNTLTNFEIMVAENSSSLLQTK